MDVDWSVDLYTGRWMHWWRGAGIGCGWFDTWVYECTGGRTWVRWSVREWVGAQVPWLVQEWA